jgi:uncharacterized damage-inducible protein DinB
MLTLSLTDLLDYTEWERQKWHLWLSQHGEQTLEIKTGPHGDGRFERVGDIIKHIFSAEKRYVERLTGRPLTDAATIPNDNVELLFQFSEQSRKEFKQLLETFPAQEWDVQREFKILTYVVKVTPKKIAMHILMHEIRHWAQIATLFRLKGFAVEFHDFLFSPVLGGEIAREQQ